MGRKGRDAALSYVVSAIRFVWRVVHGDTYGVVLGSKCFGEEEMVETEDNCGEVSPPPRTSEGCHGLIVWQAGQGRQGRMGSLHGQFRSLD